MDVAGLVTEGGTPDWAEARQPAARDAAQLAACLATGAELVGTAASDELAFSVNGRNPHRPGLRNPRAPDRLPGGSSCGPAVAVGRGLVDFALGPDVRMAATYCGVPGLRFSVGGASTEGQMPLTPTFDAVGVFAATPAILAQVAAVLTPEGAGWRPRRLLLAEDALAKAEPAIAQAAEQAALGLGLPVTRVVAVPQGLEVLSDAFRAVQAVESWRAFGDFLQGAPRVTPAVRARFEAGKAVTPAMEATARETLAGIATHLRALLGDDAVLALPTTPTFPPLADGAETVLEPLRARILALTSISGAGGLPQLCLPLRLDPPAGLSLLAPWGCDAGLAAWRA